MIKYPILFFSSLLSLNVSAASIQNLEYSPNPAYVGQKQTLSFNYFNATKCYQRKADNKEIVYYEGAQKSGTYTWTSPVRKIAENFSFTVICEGSGATAQKTVTNEVKLMTPRSCRNISTSQYSYYACKNSDGSGNEVRVSKYAYSRSGGVSDVISDFKVVGQKIFYRFRDGISKWDAFYFNDIWGRGLPQRITQYAYYNSTQLDQIKNFQIENSRAVWEFVDDGFGRNSESEWYSACPGYSSQRITPMADGKNDVKNFRINGNEATWDYYNYYFDEWEKQSTILPYCRH